MRVVEDGLALIVSGLGHVAGQHKHEVSVEVGRQHVEFGDERVLDPIGEHLGDEHQGYLPEMALKNLEEIVLFGCRDQVELV